MNDVSSNIYNWKKECIYKNIDELNDLKVSLEKLIEDSDSSNKNVYEKKITFINELIGFYSQYEKNTIDELEKMISETSLLMKSDSNEHIDVIEDGLNENLELLCLFLKKLKDDKLHAISNDNKFEIKYCEEISRLLDIPISKCSEYSKKVDNMDAVFYYNPIRGGKGMIVSNDGSYLMTVSSAISYEKLLEEYKTGRRNGSFEKNSIFKTVCRGCNNNIEIDITNFPTNVKTLDTMCPNCKSFIKFGNPNYKEESKEEDFAKINNVSELKNIVEGIFNGLTGEKNKDVEYLIKKREEYKDHILSKEILREIGRKLYEITPDEEKVKLNDAYKEDINNIKKMLKEVSSYIYGQNKDLEKAENILLDFIKGSTIYSSDSMTDYYNFDDALDFTLFTRINKPTKNIKWIDIPFVTAYFDLAYIYNERGRYDDALKMIDEASKWGPMNLGILFEKCETYKMQKKWEEFKNITVSIYDKIYKAVDLAHYYRNLGYYYIENNNYDLAYALYAASLTFEKNQHALEEMNYINQQLGRNKYDMNSDEQLTLMKNAEIPFGPKEENLKMLTDLYVQEKTLLKNVNFESILANRIYQFTKDKRFSPFIELIDNYTKCSIIVPRSWTPIKEESRKEKFGQQNMFAVYTNYNALFQANYDGKCDNEKFDEAYKLNINNMVNHKTLNMKLLNEGSSTLKLFQGTKNFKHALFDLMIDDKIIRSIHYFTIINGIFADFSITLDEKIDYKDNNKFNNQKGMIDIINLLTNIVELKDKPNIKNHPIENLVNDIDNKIIELTNLEFGEIYTNYSNNKNLNKANEYIESLFANKKVEDPFWIVIAKNVLLVILVNLMEDKKRLVYDDLKFVLSDKNNVFNLCKNGVSIKENSEYEKIAGNIKSSGDKIIESGFELIKECIGIKEPLKKQVTHQINFNNELSFNITFNEELGNLTHPNDTTFKIDNNISILYAKCNSADLLESRANEWLINSAKTNNQTIDEKYDKNYTINNGTINIIGKGVVKDNKIRYYRFIHFGQHMIIFGYNKKDLLPDIENAIISIKYTKELKKIERNPFSPKLKKSIDDFIDKDNLIEIVKSFVNPEDEDYIELITDIVNKIKKLEFERETTISELIDYNPESAFVDPLSQGKIINYIKNISKDIGIDLIENHDEFGGLAFYYKFRKVNKEILCPICNDKLML